MHTHGRAAALIYGPDLHHLDHLASICHLMEIPLLVTEEEVAASARQFYPHIQVVYLNYQEIAPHLVEHFKVIFSCLPRVLFDEIFFFAQKFRGRYVSTIWCPHGNSDKGHHSAFFEALDLEKVALVYGQKMIDFLTQKGVFEKLKAHVVIGNLRKQDYHKYRAFYHGLAQKALKKLSPKRKTILYAPTWQDGENSSSFFDAAPYLLRDLPETFNLIIKLHPNLLHQSLAQVESYLLQYEEHPQVLFLHDFPPIYPLLDQVDIYVGDMSSIGYDFLAFNKPMFFLNQQNRSLSDPGVYLFRCGVEIRKEHYPTIYKVLTEQWDQSAFAEVRQEVYRYTFGKEKDPALLQKEIQSTYALFEDAELDLYDL